MKISTVLLASAITLCSASAFANNVAFTKQADNFETEACYTAATEGLASAKSFIASNNVNYTEFKNSVMCNGMKINQFARKYFKAGANSQETVEIVAISAMDQSPESLLCVDAVRMGEKEARKKHNIKTASVRCNGKDIGKFLESFKDRKVVQTNDSEDTIASL